MRTFKIFSRLIFNLLLGQSVLAQSKNNYPCLPKGITSESVVTATLVTPPAKSFKTYLKDKLKTMKAICTCKEVVDSNNRETRFHRLVGCWGYMPPDAKEIFARNRRELEEL